MEELVKNLKESGVLKSPQIVEAFLKVDRQNFVPPDLKNLAYADEALPIGQGQTIPQPWTVAFMLELLQPKKGSKIMDVGYGSGWVTALLAEAVGPKGKIYALERVPELCDFGCLNITTSYPELIKRILFYCQDASLDIFDAPSGGFDGIITAAELVDVPKVWRERLKIGGRLVYPKAGAIFKEVKTGANDYKIEKYPGFAFVPFVEDNHE